MAAFLRAVEGERARARVTIAARPARAGRVSIQREHTLNNWLGGGLVLAMGMAAQAALAQETVTPAQLQQLDATVERVREQFDVPGVAVAVVKDGKVILQRGWGVRELGKPEQVQADTLFAIASNTKAFTATALNLLAEDGKLKMDDRVIDHLPSFRMSDSYVTGEMRIRDLLAHRSGLSLGPVTCCSGRPPPTPMPRSWRGWPRCHSRAASATATPTTTSSMPWPSR
jgi:CubicO group peptidase (beta-lactamase class C family)